MLNSGEEIGGGLMPLRIASEKFGVSSSYLRFLIFKKKLRGTKIGKVWFTKQEWVRDCIAGGRNAGDHRLSEEHSPTPVPVEAMSHLPVIRETYESSFGFKKSEIASAGGFSLKIAPDGTVSLPKIVIKEIVIEGTTIKGQILIEPEAA